MRDILRRWLPLFVWVVLIFALSSIPDLTPGDMKLPHGTDKVVHFTEYAILAVLFYRGLSYGSRRFNWVFLIVTMATAAGLGGLDELYQSYVPGRDSSFMDLMADFAGIGAGSIFTLIKDRRKITRG